MKIQFTPSIYSSKSHNNLKNTAENKEKYNVNYSYNPVAYKDFNITFGARLFRSPENFYEQDFNKENMPKTLREYIYESWDSDFRKTIPPAQAMKEVFGKIEFAQNLDMVKMMYPDEPLFANLTSTPKRKSREGLLGAINLLKDDPEYKGKTLFKNGNNDLGLYILKKIYIEGKTLEEINKDFSKDVSVYFKSFDIKPQDYSAFGIKFPKHSFWHSFLPTRTDRNFKYVRLPKNLEERVAMNKAAERKAAASHNQSTPVVKKPRKPLDFVQRKKLSEFMVNWHANLTPEEKAELRRKQKIGMEDSILHNYFGEIVTMAQDKVNLSDTMAEYFEKIYGTPDYLSYLKDNKSKQSEIMSKFWKQHEMLRKDYSKAMIETIAEFDEAYGEDGENYDILRLVALARGINKNNEEGRLIRNKIRDEIKAEKAKDSSTSDNFDKLLHKEVSKPNAKIYSYKFSDGTEFNIVADLKEMLWKKIDDEMLYFPKSYVETYKQFMWNENKNNHKVLLSLLYENGEFNNLFDIKSSDGVPENAEDDKVIYKKFADEFLYSSEEVLELSQNLTKKFMRKYPQQVKAAREVLLEMMADTEIAPDIFVELVKAKTSEVIKANKYPNLSRFEIVKKVSGEIREMANNFKGNRIIFLSPELLNGGLRLFNADINKFDMAKLDSRYKSYFNKLSNSDVKKIAEKIVDCLAHYDENKSALGDQKSKSILKVISVNVASEPELRKSLIAIILKNNLITPENSDLRAFITDGVPQRVLEARTEELITKLFNELGSVIPLLLAINENSLKLYIKPVDEKLYNDLVLYRTMAAIDIVSKMNKK